MGSPDASVWWCRGCDEEGSRIRLNLYDRGMPTRPHIHGPDAFAAAFVVSRETVDKLETYASLLTKWQKTINLVAPSTLDDIWHRHFADSAQLLAASVALPPPSRGRVGEGGMADQLPSGFPPPLAPPRKGEGNATSPALLPLRWLDVGSGAGFPGLVLAILLAETPGARMTLIESDQRKAAFLREVARQTRAPVDILSIRIESAATQINLPLPEVVTARALAPLGRLLDLVFPFFGPDTVGLFLKGRDAEREIAEARQNWQFSVVLRESLTDPAARIVTVRNVEAKSKE